MDFTPSPSLNLNSTTLSSIKVLDALDSITIPRLRLDSRSSTSQQCTRIHHEVFKASVRAAKAARAENGIGPALYIKPSDGMLDLLGGILVQGIKGDAMLDEKTICLIRSIPPRMELEKVGAEKTHHPQCRSVHGTVSGSLYGADIYRPAIILKKREWNIEESGPAQNHGKTDLLGQVSNMYGVMEKLVIWEYKRDLVLSLRHLITMYSLANEGDGVIIDLNDMGEVVMRCSDDDKLGDVKMFLQQVVVEFDANDTSLLLLTSWSHAILFHRASPNLIYLSSIIPNDPHDLDLRIGSRPNSAYSVGVRPDWRLFKLVYASLLGADQPEVKSRCWSRGSALDLTEVLRKIAKEKDKGKKRKRDEGVEPAEGRSGGDFEGEAGVDDRGAADVAEAMADPQEVGSTSSGSDDRQDDSTETTYSPDTSLDFPSYSLDPSGTAVHLRLLPEVMRQAQCNGRHALTDRDWSSVQWQQLRPSHPDDFDDDVDFHDPVNPFIPSPADMGKPRAIEVGSMTLVPARYLTHGRLYTVYHGHLVISCTTSTSTLDSKSNSEADSNTSPTVVPVILKLVDCESFSEHPCPAGEGYTPKEALAAVVNEVRMYTGRLRKLQGVLVPRFYGAWMGCSNPWRIGSGPILIVALEDVGLGVGTEDLAEEDRNAIKALYTSLHSAGVLHGDVEPRHVLKHHCRPHPDLQHPSSNPYLDSNGAGEGWRLIDFEAAQEMDIGTGYGEGARMVREAEYEMDRVRIILGS